MQKVLLFKNGGAWFVSYDDADSNRLQLLKSDGRPKGFRSIDTLVALMGTVFGIQIFDVHNELPKRRNTKKCKR